MSEEQIRAEFETWALDTARKHNYTHMSSLFARRDDGSYKTSWVDTAFLAWQAALSAKSVPEVDEAAMELRVVYEAARKFLRYNGVDKDKVNQAVDELDEAIEAVKHIDGGYKDFPLEAALSAKSVPPIERDVVMQRDYIPLPANWEIQTKGRGSTFRLAKTDGSDIRWPILEEMLHEPLEQMAREIHAAWQAAPQPTDDRVRELESKYNELVMPVAEKDIGAVMSAEKESALGSLEQQPDGSVHFEEYKP